MPKPIKYEAKKLYKGFVSVRDYIVEKAIKQKADIIVTLNNEEMLIPYYNLLDRKQLHSRKFKSQFTNEEYELYDFKWNSSKQESLI